MSAQALPPKRIADYFFMVGLHDDHLLLDQPHSQESNPNDKSNNPKVDPMLNGCESSNNPLTLHSSLFNGDTSNGKTTPSTSLTLLNAHKSITIKVPNRARSKSMAQVARPQFKQALPDLSASLSDDEQLHSSLIAASDKPFSEGIKTFLTERPAGSRRTTTYATNSRRPARSATLSDVSQHGGIRLQHKPSYRHISAGTLYKTVQEGIQRDLSKDLIREDDEKDGNSDLMQSQAAVGMQTGPVTTQKRDETNPTDTSAHENTNEVVQHLPDIHPAERFFSPVVTCRYPETDWEDAEAFPPHLPMFCFPGNLSFKLQSERPPTTYHSFVMTQETGNRSYAMCVTLYERLPKSMQQQFEVLCQRWTRSQMSESEVEYVKAIKLKINSEKSLLQSLRDRLRQQRTLGRQQPILDLKREIVETEEKLLLLEDQMQPWKRLFIEAEDVWIPRCVGLVSAIPYHYLLRDWLLAVVVACSGGVDHPGMSLSSLRLERYVRNIIHDVSVPPHGKLEIAISINNRLIYASRPALNSVPIVKNVGTEEFSEDIVTLIEVMLSEGKIIFLSSHLGMLTLASESILYLFFPLYWQGVYIPILPAALMTCLQAPVPYIIGVERSCCDPDFPPEDACVVDLDKGTVDVQLAPVPLPPRPRRKLIQSLEQYAPFTTASRRSAVTTSTPGATAPAITMQNETYSSQPTSGPPTYVQEAYPHSRLTLFCGVSRAPRQRDSLRPPAASTFSTLSNSASSSVQDLPSPAVSRRSSTIALNMTSGLNLNTALPRIPKVDFEKETLMEGFGELARTMSRGDQSRVVIGESNCEKNSIPSASETRDLKTNKVAPDQDMAGATRKLLSPQSALEPTAVEQESALQHQPANVDRSNSVQSTHLTASNTVPVKQLVHRSSVASMESSNFRAGFSQGPATGTGSPASTMTSNTMISIHGPTLTVGHQQDSSSSSMVSLPQTQTNTFNHSISNHSGGVGFVEEEVESEPSPMVPISKEGHVLLFVSSPIPMSLLNSRCGICTQVLAAHQHMYRCEGCTLIVHSGCIEELLYPCVPRGFDESGICWSVLQTWAGLLKGYRTGILAGQQAIQQQQILLQMEMQNQQFLKNNGHSRQMSSGSEGMGNSNEKENRFSWASLRGWASRSSTSSNTSIGPPTPPMDQRQPPPQQQQHSTTRARRGTNTSIMSDTVRFHRDVFLRGVDKDAKAFMTVFTETQAFVQFVQDRVDRSPGDPEIMFFDEVIKAKINRSRFRIGKEETRFLDDTSYGIQGTSKAVPPSGELHEY
ncbi:hypothetical protein BGX27_001508, partial [Mortierella sp. AM989]